MPVNYERSADRAASTTPAEGACAICGATGGTMHAAREMMFGTREAFEYRECSTCGCLSLANIPADLQRFYPADYYSLKPRVPHAARRMRDRLYLSAFSWLVNWRGRADLDVIRRVKLSKSQRLLDVGSGSGHLVADLRDLGYRAEGVDPFVGSDVVDGDGVRVHCKNLAEMNGGYDALLFRHSLEHMPEQLETLRLARERLKSGGVCVVCIPVLGWAWKNYGTDWSQLDAPRHLYLHTPESLERIAVRAGFRVEKIVFDSDEFQFWPSELYRQDRPLVGARPPGFLAMMRWKLRAWALNRNAAGDKAQFYLRAV